MAVEVEAVIQRPLKGSRISSFYPVRTLPPLSSLNSAFQLQEYISLLIRLDVHDVEAIVSIPGRSGSKERDGSEVKSEDDGRNDVAVDEACWIYEQLRRLAQDLSHPLITMLQLECTRATCPEMKAGEWLYLCVAHGNDGAMEQCCAIDYILHTLDSATALLNSPRAFPSRLQIPQTSHRHFSSLARRLGRIFAHAYFHHREAFEQAEVESSLYARFLALTSKFDLVPPEFLVIPPRMASIGLHDEHANRGTDLDVEPPRLLAASIEPHHGRESGQWLKLGESSDVAQDNGPASIPRNESPRKMGRNRTDTMVFSEAVSVAEELAKADLTEAELNRAVAEERTAEAAGNIIVGDEESVDAGFTDVPLHDTSAAELVQPWSEAETVDAAIPVPPPEPAASLPESTSEATVAAVLSESLSDEAPGEAAPEAPQEEATPVESAPQDASPQAEEEPSSSDGSEHKHPDVPDVAEHDDATKEEQKNESALVNEPTAVDSSAISSDEDSSPVAETEIPEENVVAAPANEVKDTHSSEDDNTSEKVPEDAEPQSEVPATNEEAEAVAKLEETVSSAEPAATSEETIVKADVENVES